MDALPVRPETPHAPQRTTHRPAHRPAHRGAAAAAPASPGDLAALAQQAQFDAIASARAEQQREMNALRDLAMQQVKRDDQALNDWIRLI